MDIVQAKRKVLDLLRVRGKAGHGTLIELLGGDRELYQVVCDELVFEDLVTEEKAGVTYIGGATPAAADEEIAPEDVDLEDEPAQKLRIFLSYGHDSTTPFAKELELILKERGHDAWIDYKRLVPGFNWEHAIEDGLEKIAGDNNGRFVLIMTRHSVGRRNAYCIKELSKAVQLDVSIVPIMLEDVAPPFSINDIHYLDMRDCIPIEQYLEKFNSKQRLLISALEKEDALYFQGAQHRIALALRPVSFGADIAHALERFTERDWLVTQVDDWLQTKGAARVFWIAGFTGMGKTALACWLGAHRGEVAALHLCESGHDQKGTPRGIIRSIAWQLSRKLPGYLDQLRSIVDLREICQEDNASTLIDRLLIQPLYRAHYEPEAPIVIIIDGLDEASSTEDGIEFATLLERRIDRFPAWIRFILTTSSKGSAVIGGPSRPGIDIDEHKDNNLDDIHRFLEAELGPYAPDEESFSRAVRDLARKSEGNFLYVEWIRKELEARSFNFDSVHEFPQGLAKVYAEFLQRKFPDVTKYRETYQPILEVIAAARGPLPLSLLEKIFEWSGYEARRIRAVFGSLFSVRDGIIRPFHRSLLAWLADPEKSQRYFVSASEGHKRLAIFGWHEYEQDVSRMPDYMKSRLPEHLHQAEETEKLIACVTDARYVYFFGKARFLYSLAEYWKEIDGPTLQRRCLESLRSRPKIPVDEMPFLALCGLSLGRLFQQTGDYPTAMRCFQRAHECSRVNAGDSTPARARFHIGWCQRHMDQFEEAIATLEQAQSDFQELVDRAGEGRSLSAMGICYWHLQKDSHALDCLNKALYLLEQTSEKRHHAEALNHLGIVYRGVGLYDEAQQSFSAAEAMFEEIHDLAGLGKLYNSMGTGFWWAGNASKALDMYARADETNEVIQQLYVLGLTANNRGYMLLESGQFNAACDEFERARSIRRQLGSESYEMMDLSGMARAKFHAGRIEEARKLSRKALRGLAGYPKVEDFRRAYYNHYLNLKDSDDLQEAADALRKAKDIVNERLQFMDDQELRSSFVGKVPIVKDILAAELPGHTKPDQ